MKSRLPIYYVQLSNGFEILQQVVAWQYHCRALCKISKGLDEWNRCYGRTRFRKIWVLDAIRANIPYCTRLILLKSLLFTWRSRASRFHLPIPDLHMIANDLTWLDVAWVLKVGRLGHHCVCARLIQVQLSAGAMMTWLGPVFNQPAGHGWSRNIAQSYTVRIQLRMKNRWSITHTPQHRLIALVSPCYDGSGHVIKESRMASQYLTGREPTEWQKSQ